jgi:uncharacterized membrane protein
MTPQIDPIWPWRLLVAGLSTAPASVTGAVIAAGLVALAFPILLVRYPVSSQRRRLFLGAGLVLAGLLAWIGFGHAWETPLEMTTSGGGAWLARLAGIGLALLFVVPMALVGVTAATYLGAANSSPRRTAIILSLRAAAFLLAAVAILRPYLAIPREGAAGGDILLIAVDVSKSMTIQDESSRSRWDAMLQALHDAGPALERLKREQNVQIEFVRFADKVEPFSLDNPGAPDGKRTDIGGMLKSLYEQYGGRRVRGVLVLSDGRNNGGQRIDPFAEARRWRRRAPIHTFAFGNPNTPNGQRDVAVTGVTATPPVVPIKGKLTVRATINAHGFENSSVRIHLFLDDKEVKAQDATLKLTENNQITLECDAPDKSGEVKVMVKVDPLPGELNRDNNQLGTFVTVVKGGLNVLLIDKERAWEPQMIYDALARDPRIQVKPLWLRGNAPTEPNAGSLFDFDKQKYDVIIIGDVTAAQMTAIQPDVLDQIVKQVYRGAGFLMIGGYSSFGDGDWNGTPVGAMLPVDLSVRGQVEGGRDGVKMVPTDEGLRLYSRILRIAGGDEKAERAAWEALPGLEGVNRLALPAQKGNEVVLAESTKDLVDPQTMRPYPLLVARDYGNGRVLAFAGDTTNRWIRNPEGKREHGRFWRQMVLWLAQQDEDQSQARVVPDVRAIAVGNDLGFSLGLRGKNGDEVKGGDYVVEVETPGGERKKVTPTRDGTEDRGLFRPETAGQYTIHIRGSGKDMDGQDVSGEASARFLAFEEDVEMAEWAADEGFLRKLADEGRGEFRRGSKLAAFLEQLPPSPAAKTKPKVDADPDWNSASWSPFFVLFYLLFTGLLAGEWFLRRRWGMV